MFPIYVSIYFVFFVLLSFFFSFSNLVYRMSFSSSQSNVFYASSDVDALSELRRSVEHGRRTARISSEQASLLSRRLSVAAHTLIARYQAVTRDSSQQQQFQLLPSPQMTALLRAVEFLFRQLGDPENALAFLAGWFNGRCVFSQLTGKMNRVWSLHSTSDWRKEDRRASESDEQECITCLSAANEGDFKAVQDYYESPAREPSSSASQPKLQQYPSPPAVQDLLQGLRERAAQAHGKNPDTTAFTDLGEIDNKHRREPSKVLGTSACDSIIFPVPSVGDRLSRSDSMSIPAEQARAKEILKFYRKKASEHGWKIPPDSLSSIHNRGRAFVNENAPLLLPVILNPCDRVKQHVLQTINTTSLSPLADSVNNVAESKSLCIEAQPVSEANTIQMKTVASETEMSLIMVCQDSSASKKSRNEEHPPTPQSNNWISRADRLRKKDEGRFWQYHELRYSNWWSPEAPVIVHEMCPPFADAPHAIESFVLDMSVRRAWFHPNLVPLLGGYTDSLLTLCNADQSSDQPAESSLAQQGIPEVEEEQHGFIVLGAVYPDVCVRRSFSEPSSDLGSDCTSVSNDNRPQLTQLSGYTSLHDALFEPPSDMKFSFEFCLHFLLQLGDALQYMLLDAQEVPPIVHAAWVEMSPARIFYRMSVSQEGTSEDDSLAAVGKQGSAFYGGDGWPLHPCLNSLYGNASLSVLYAPPFAAATVPSRDWNTRRNSS